MCIKILVVLSLTFGFYGTAARANPASGTHAGDPPDAQAQKLVKIWDRTHDPLIYQQLQELHEQFHNPVHNQNAPLTKSRAHSQKRLLQTQNDFELDSSKKIEPSPLKNGNVTGNQFPLNTWSITFDDGPHATLTEAVLKNLADQNMQATFFEVAKQVTRLKSVSLAVQNAGHEMASHSYTHANLYKVTPQELQHEISDAVSDQSNVWLVRPRLFRAPYGNAYHTEIRNLLAQENLIHIFWNVDTLDWVTSETPNTIYARAVKQIEENQNQGHGGIILFHDIHERSVHASLKVMQYLKQKNYRVLPVGKVIDEINSSLR